MKGAAVSILTRPEGRVQRRAPMEYREPRLVSILTRPEGRVQLGGTDEQGRAEGFQSSPVPKDGCNCSRKSDRASRSGFNPHPSRRTGATLLRRCRLAVAYLVSILTRPEGRVQRGLRGRHSIMRRVSILTRPEGRVQRGSITTQKYLVIPVSILTRPEGRVQPGCASHAKPCRLWFQSSPVPKDGCNSSAARRICRLVLVSILTRPEGRVQPPPEQRHRLTARCFNPHPSRRTGATHTNGCSQPM